MHSKVNFISGHLNLTEEEFKEHYVPRIDKALADDDSFVVGDASGADSLAQSYLKDKCERVTVYHMLIEPRNNHGFPTVGGFTTDLKRDEQMTSVSDCDIAWVRPGKEKSGTQKNIARRNTFVRFQVGD